MNTLDNLIELPLNSDDSPMVVNTKEWFEEFTSIQEETDKQYKELYDVYKSDYQAIERSGSKSYYFSWFKRAS